MPVSDGSTPRFLAAIRSAPRFFQFVSRAAIAMIAGCVPIPGPGPGDGDGDVIELSFDFRDGTQLGWEADISDYEPGQIGTLQFESEIREFPPETGIEATGFYVQSFNTPDDLFTFIRRRLGPDDGIVPGQDYRITYDIYFASNAPSGCFGVGGAPGESVYLKVGGSAIEPMVVAEDGGFRLNLDKGDQAQGGAAASVASTLANGISCDLIPNLEEAPYVLLSRMHTHETNVRAAADGTLWLLVGVESGYEALTGVYYQRIDVHLEPVD